MERCSASGSKLFLMFRSPSLLLFVIVVGLVSCGHSSYKPTQQIESFVLAKKVGKYAWSFQLTVRDQSKSYERTAWFTMPHIGRTPVLLEDCSGLSAQASFSNSGRWIQPSGPKWHGYVYYDPDAKPGQLELRCVERSNCACRHFEHSDLSGVHPVKLIGAWKKPPE